MNAVDDSSYAKNPFSTRHVRPGAIGYRFPAGKSAAVLIARLEKNDWQGQIVGPHGSGKSALVATLIAEIVRDAPYSVSAKNVVEAMQQGDWYATEIIIQAMNYLGIGIANLVNLFNPEVIVIGGGLSNLGDRLLDPVRRGIALHAFPTAAREVRVMLAELGDDVGIVGAAGSAIMLSRKS